MCFLLQMLFRLGLSAVDSSISKKRPASRRLMRIWLGIVRLRQEGLPICWPSAGRRAMPVGMRPTEVLALGIWVMPVGMRHMAVLALGI